MVKQGRVLVVDDEPDLGYLLMALMEAEGYRAVLAQSGIEALELVKRLKPSVVLLDLSLPDLDGITVLRRLREHEDGPKIPVLVLSAYTARLTEADRAMVQGVFEKPFDLDAVAETVARLLRTNTRVATSKTSAPSPTPAHATSVA